VHFIHHVLDPFIVQLNGFTNPWILWSHDDTLLFLSRAARLPVTILPPLGCSTCPVM
jgi:hypothetical protein